MAKKKRPHGTAGPSKKGKGSVSTTPERESKSHSVAGAAASRPQPHTDDGGDSLLMPDRYARAVPVLIALAALLLAADLVVPAHRYFPVEKVWGFYGFVGFAGGALLLLTARVLPSVAVAAENHHDR